MLGDLTAAQTLSHLALKSADGVNGSCCCFAGFFWLVVTLASSLLLPWVAGALVGSALVVTAVVGWSSEYSRRDDYIHEVRDRKEIN